MEQGDQGREMRAETPRWNVRRTFHAHRRQTRGTGDGRELMLRDGGQHGGQVPDLLAEDRTGGRQVSGDGVLTVRTGHRCMEDKLRDLLRREEVTLVTGMTRLGATFPSRWGFGRTRRCTRRITGRRA